jgi:hypothetical protein
MKKALYAISFSILLLSCKNELEKKEGCLSDTINVKKAYKMIHHYGDSAVGHNLNDIIRFFRIENSCLNELSSINGVTTFWTAADTNTNKPLIIAETWEKGETKPQWHMLKAIICPPPPAPPCDTLNGDDFAEFLP